MLRSLSSNRNRFVRISLNPSYSLQKNYFRFQSTSKPTLSLSSKLFENYPQNVGLYDKSLEKDSCGVGLVAQMKKEASRQIVLDANQMLVRMSHRGGCGCEPNTGDGAGILLGMPDSYYRRALNDELNIELGPLNSYGTGIVFTPKSNESLDAIKSIFEDQVTQLGHRIIGWRKIVTYNHALGESAKLTEPRMEQLFIENSKNLPFHEFDRELYRIRKMVETEAQVHPDLLGNIYICSLSSQTITYKGNEFSILVQLIVVSLLDNVLV